MKIILLVILLLIFVPLIFGLFLPEKRIFVKKAKFQATPEEIWNIITTIKEQEKWRSDIKEVNIIDGKKGEEKWIEILQSGHKISFETKTYQPPHRFDIEIAGSVFSGYWEGNITRIENGAKVEFTEVVIIKNPYMRVLSYFFLDLNSAMELYVQDLRKSIEE